jgi:hypothetical protein
MEQVSFVRGIDPKKALDIGVRRSENLSKFIEEGLKEFLGKEYVCERGPKRSDGSYSWVKFLHKEKLYRKVLVC